MGDYNDEITTPEGVAPCVALEPVNPSAEAPRDKDGKPLMLYYGPSSWATLVFHLAAFDVKPPLPREPIDEPHCKLIATTLAEDLETEYLCSRPHLEQQILMWQTSGGFLQRFVGTEHASFEAELLEAVNGYKAFMEQPPVLH